MEHNVLSSANIYAGGIKFNSIADTKSIKNLKNDQITFVSLENFFRLRFIFQQI